MAEPLITTPNAPLCSPSELVAQVKAGDIAVLDKLTRCYGERLVRVGQRYCRDSDQAMDAVQDALLSAGEHLQSFRGDGSLEGWLTRMVANACHHMRRGRKNDPALHTTEVDVDSPLEDDPEEVAARAQLAEALGSALLDLQPQDRMLVLLAEAEDWTGPQIAKALDMTPGAVRSRLTRARAKLRESLKNSEFVPN